jgi:hypothetical protein
VLLLLLGSCCCRLRLLSSEDTKWMILGSQKAGLLAGYCSCARCGQAVSGEATKASLVDNVLPLELVLRSG